jgi:hypothetical protein
MGPDVEKLDGRYDPRELPTIPQGIIRKNAPDEDGYAQQIARARRELATWPEWLKAKRDL